MLLLWAEAADQLDVMAALISSICQGSTGLGTHVQR